MVCLTNKDIAERLLPRWLVLSLKGKKKKILDGKKNEITVCQREIDRCGRQGDFCLRFAFCSPKRHCERAGESTDVSSSRKRPALLTAGPLLRAVALRDGICTG